MKQHQPQWKACWVDQHELLIDVGGLDDEAASIKAWRELATRGVKRSQVIAFYRYSENVDQ